MKYIPLAIKWRPKLFSQVVGQDNIIKSIQNSIKLKKIHHAYLFSGTRGVGKTTIARLLAKSLNCNSKITFNICNICNSCKEINLGNSPDLIEIDAASKTRIEDIKELQEHIPYSPTYSRFKIYLIDEIHMLSKHSFNALLKILEEPPKHIKFILATTNFKKIPITILSRCLHFHLQSLTINTIIKQLKYIFIKENILFDYESLKLLAISSNGSMRDSLTLSEKAILLGNNKITIKIVKKILGIINTLYPINLIKLLINNDAKKIIKYIEKLSLNIINFDNILIDILSILHNITIIKFTNYKYLYSNNIYSYDILIKISKKMSQEKIYFYYKSIIIGRKELIYSPNKKIGFEMIFLRMLNN